MVGAAIAEFDYQVVHRPGKNHTNADCLSRVPCKQCGLSEALDDAVSCDVVQMEAILPTWSPEDLKSAQRSDADLMEVISWFESNSIPPSPPVQAKLKTLWFQKDQLILKEGGSFTGSGKMFLEVDYTGDSSWCCWYL